MISRGSSLTSGVTRGQGSAEVSGTGETLEVVKRCPWASWRTVLAAQPAAHPDNAAAYLVRAYARQVAKAPELCDLVLSYSSDFWWTAGAPDTETYEHGGTTEIDIRAFAAYAGVSDADREKIDAAIANNTELDAGVTATDSVELYQKLRRGQRTVLIPTLQVTIVTYHASKGTSVQGVLGTRAVPSGYSGSNLWLIVGGGWNKSGEWWAKTLVYEFASNGWDTDIYGT